MHSPLSKKDLWLALAAYHFDNLVPPHLWDIIKSTFGGQNPFTIAFADKLCRKLGWKKSFAMKAIWEYKKFVYLGVISDFRVTPSKYIDQVWHEHILFSAGYRKFCEEVIRYPFDHNPELIPLADQTHLFMDQFQQTIDLYAREFGSQPPNDIWQITKFRNKASKRKQSKHKARQEHSPLLAWDTGSDTLISQFPETESSDFDFGSGSFGGGGASGDWGDSESSDSGDSGDSGCSSCSSSCGGGD